MNEHTFMSKLHKPGFTYSTCESFTKHCKKIQKVKETGNLKHIYKNFRYDFER